MFVYPDALGLAELEASLLGELRLGAYPDGEEDEVGCERRPRLEAQLEAFAYSLEGSYGLLEVERDALTLELLGAISTSETSRPSW